MTYKYKVKPTDAQRQKALNKYNNRCVCCNKEYYEIETYQAEAGRYRDTPSTLITKKSLLHLHRILPGENGGRYTADNVVLVCSSCHIEVHQFIRKKNEHNKQNI